MRCGPQIRSGRGAFPTNELGELPFTARALGILAHKPDRKDVTPSESAPVEALGAPTVIENTNSR